MALCTSGSAFAGLPGVIAWSTLESCRRYCTVACSISAMSLPVMT
jgi:hypothetical protein